MGQLAAKIAGFDDLKKDVEDLKQAAQLMRGITGHLEGKADMINDGFNKLVQAKSMVDSQIGSAMASVNNVGNVTQTMLTKLTDVEKELENIKKKADQISATMNAGKKFQQGDVMGGLNDIKNQGFGGFGGFGGGNAGGGGGFGGFGF